MRRSRIRLAAWTTTLALLVGCGGGGSSGDPVLTNANLNGFYTIVCIGSASTLSMGTSTSVYGNDAYDGAGAHVPFSGSNVDGTATGLAIRPNGTYSVAADGTLTIDNALRGYLSLDGARFVASSFNDMSVPEICIGFLPSGTLSNATLSGDYHHGFLTMTGGGAGFARWTQTASGAAVFDGTGGFTYPTVRTNSNGTLGTDAGGAATYGISGSGEFTVSTVAGTCLGTVSANGQLAFASGALPGAGGPAITAFIQKGTSMSNAHFAGQYMMVGIDVDPVTGNWRSFTSAVQANGAGASISGLNPINTEGAISFANGNANYFVDVDGSLFIDNYQGAVSPDGNYAFLCGENVAMGRPAFLILLRR